MRQSRRLHTPKALVHCLLLYSRAQIGIPGELCFVWLCSNHGGVSVSLRKKRAMSTSLWLPGLQPSALWGVSANSEERKSST